MRMRFFKKVIDKTKTKQTPEGIPALVLEHCVLHLQQLRYNAFR